MVKHLLTKSMLLLVALVAGGASAWAEEKSYTLTFKTSGTTNDSGTAWSSSTSKVSDVLTGGGDYVSSISVAANVYPARDGRGAKFGTSSKAGSITFALSDDGKVKATKVVIKGGAYISSGKAEAASVKVNNGTAVAFDQTVTTYTEEDITYNFPTATDITSLSLEQATASKGRMYIVSVTIYYEEDTTEGETATWTLNPATATVMTGENTSIQLTTNYDGTLAFMSNNTEVATVSYNSSTKIITITGVSVGSTTISATGDATATYKAISKSISVTVNHAELTSNFTTTMGPLGYSYFGVTPEGNNAYAQPDVASTDKTNNNGISISFARNGSSNTKPRFDSDYTRFYVGNTLTFTAPSGSYITKIVFTEPSSNKSWGGDMTASTGDYVNSDKTWYATSTDVTSLVLTEKSGTNRIGGINIYLMATPSATITEAGYATWTTNFNVEVPSGVSAYIVTSTSTGYVAMEELLAIPAGTPVVLNAVANTYDFDLCDNETLELNDADVNDNLLLISDGTTAVGDDIYVLANKEQGVGFYRWASENSLSKGRVYLQIAAEAREFIGFSDESTGISTIEHSPLTIDHYYNLRGQRVNAPAKGLYIKNGKKVVVK